MSYKMHEGEQDNDHNIGIGAVQNPPPRLRIIALNALEIGFRDIPLGFRSIPLVQKYFNRIIYFGVNSRKVDTKRLVLRRG